MPGDDQATRQAVVSMATAFVAGDLQAAEFERRFLKVFADLPGPDASFDDAVEEIFWAVETYVSDPAVREPGDLDDEGLRLAVARHLPAVREQGDAG